ncbi:hypothetical protein HW532_11420 [Kaustia mangrovi]|uniref:Uncharacterized protein n=1 Tax=Kaustia mangrovi TaxID=2593653 RepID=A0A7S8HC52_9HYPH|nr:hypothetical protein [Kaustia mangrovi]QPC43246.1 hypothetical protein HW532_11420 [Kaustia mangrovi]
MPAPCVRKAQDVPIADGPIVEEPASEDHPAQEASGDVMKDVGRQLERMRPTISVIPEGAGDTTHTPSGRHAGPETGGGDKTGEAFSDATRSMSRQQATENAAQSMQNSDMLHRAQMMSAQMKHDQALANHIQQLATDLQSDAQANLKQSLQKLGETARA